MPGRVVLYPARPIRARRPRVHERDADEKHTIQGEHCGGLCEEALRIRYVLKHVVHGNNVETLAMQFRELPSDEAASSDGARLEREKWVHSGQIVKAAPLERA